MRVFTGIVSCMLALPAAAMTLPISSNFCYVNFTVTVTGIEFEDGSCNFTAIANRGAGGWDVECDNDPLVIEPSKDDTLTLTYPGDFDSYVLHRCPTDESLRVILGQFAG